jgi:ABC-2 type transport system ATP-binding protein
MLNVVNATKSYDGKKRAINELSFQIKPGDLLGFVGHNGAGKTTLLKAIAGIHALTSGDIRLGDLSIKDNALAFKKRIAYIPDHPDLYESLTGRQFIDFIGDVFAVPLNERNLKINDLSVQFDMHEFLKNPIHSYSHGMKQKVALIAAFIHKPELLILDEPFVGLDPKAAFALKANFKQLTDQGGMIIFSSHVLEVVEKIANKLVIIRQGTLLANGPTHTILKDKNLETLFMEQLR